MVEVESRYKDFEEAIRALISAGASLDAVVEVFSETAGWISHIAAPKPELQTARQSLACSFCAKTQHEVGKLIAGPGVYICDECTRRMAVEARTISSRLGGERCSFCGKTLASVATIVGGPTTHVCDQCLDLCVEILREEEAPNQS